MNQHASAVNAGLSMAPIRNVALMMELVTRLKDRAPGLPGMGCFYGPSGFGKTTAAAFAAIQTQAYVVELRSAYTAKHLLSKIALEMGLEDKGTTAQLVDRVAEQLAKSLRPLIVDEADHAVKKSMIEVIRDLYDASDGVVLLIGEERLPAKLEKWERVHGRMLDFVGAEAASASDARILARMYCPGIQIGDALYAQVMKESGPSVRRIVVNLNHIRERANEHGVTSINVDAWKGDEFSNGRAPKARRFA